MIPEFLAQPVESIARYVVVALSQVEIHTLDLVAQPFGQVGGEHPARAAEQKIGCRSALLLLGRVFDD